MENLSQTKTEQLVFPFAVPSENRKEQFSREAEIGAIYCNAELERGKGGGLILKQQAEKIAFLSEFLYPLWLVPWEKQTLVLDGLGTFSHHLEYNTMPDMGSFMENLKNGSRALETYTTFLADNTNTIQPSEVQTELVFNGLITQERFLEELTQHLSEVKQFAAIPPEAVKLPTFVDKTAITNLKQEFQNLKALLQEQTDRLYEMIKLINKTTNAYTKMIQGKTKAIGDEYAKEIAGQEAIAAPRTKGINAEYEAQMVNLQRNFKKQLFPLQKEKIKLERTLEQTLSKIQRYKNEIKLSKAKKAKVSEEKWKEKKKDSEREASQLKSQIEKVNGKIKDVEDKKTLETFRIKSDLETKIREVRKEILELEASRDTKIQSRKQEIEKLTQLTSSLIEQLSKLTRIREKDLIELEKLRLPSAYQEDTIAHIPFYVACYQADSQKRYTLFLPSCANSIGLATKLKGVLGRAKIKQLLIPRMNVISSLITNLPNLMDQNPAFEREIYEAGVNANILLGRLAQVRSGLEQLKGEGWLSEKDYDEFSQRLS